MWLHVHMLPQTMWSAAKIPIVRLDIRQSPVYGQVAALNAATTSPPEHFRILALLQTVLQNGSVRNRNLTFRAAPFQVARCAGTARPPRIRQKPPLIPITRYKSTGRPQRPKS